MTSSHIDKNSWQSKRDRLSQVIPEIIGQYYEGEEKERSIEKWKNSIILSAIWFTEDESFFETSAQAKRAIEKVNKQYQKFFLEFQKLKPFANIIISTEATSYGQHHIENTIEDLSGILLAAEKKIIDKDNYLKENKLIINKNREAITTLLFKLFDAYIDVSGNDLTIGFDSSNNKVTGELSEFVCPVIQIFDPSKIDTPESLKSLLKETIHRYKKLNIIQK